MKSHAEQTLITVLLATAVVSALLLTWTLILLYQNYVNPPLSNETQDATQHQSQ